MSYGTPAERARAVRAVRDALMASRRAVLTTHLNADGDGAGCEVAVASWLRANGTEAWIINPTPFPDAFRFLLPEDGWVIPAGSEAARQACRSADVAAVLDTGEVSRIGRVRSLIRDLPTVVVDHHPPGDKPIGGVALRDPAACATGELIYEVMEASDGPWTDAALKGLYVAILTDTGSFRFANSTPRAHRVAADLIERGVDPEEMHTRVYGAAPLRRYRLLERALATLEMDEETGIAWMIIPDDAFRELNATPDDLEGMVDVPRGIQGVHVGLLFRAASSGEIKVSFRSNGAVDVNALARRFGGGGHVRASGAMVAGPMEEVVRVVVDATRAAVRSTLGTCGGEAMEEQR